MAALEEGSQPRFARLSPYASNTIIYYSSWLSKGPLYGRFPEPFIVNDTDKNGFMVTIHKLDRKKGLDLVLHTPGGSMTATESLVEYLRSMFGTNIRAIVPQMAMSAGTMIACACDEIIMGKHSSLGPIDPQVAGLPAHAVVEEFTRAADEIRADQSKGFVWQPIIAKYSPTLISACEKAIELANKTVLEWLETGMFAGEKNAKDFAKVVVDELASHQKTLTHNRHIGPTRADAIGLNVTALEDDEKLQDKVLTLHHACMQTLFDSGVIKLIENNIEVSFIQNAQVAAVMAGQPQQMMPSGEGLPGLY